MIPARPGGYVAAEAQARPGHDQIVLTRPDGAALGNSLACARAGRAAELIVTYGVLNAQTCGGRP